ncbi:hypothetical protein MKJ01_13390 [Chryseobacterium sp. SSA4.19]|uniref:hypothetical protein n=1 Tax=Chryseobacterium sp. SSA4.19 TaxID=2919915 RepID=UPI001F4DFAC7|nr:hypothetical protein [Chryseobacterium sp. SSA4.19]MCJ8154759.1 hypothetical protein [Chryseobacterium sp. SSA4.19]
MQKLHRPENAGAKRMLRENGFGGKITLSEENNNGSGIHSHANIKLQVSRNMNSNFYANDKFPHIMFTAGKNLKRIGIHIDTIFQNSTGTAAMKAQTYTLENLDEETIEKEIVDSIEKILVNR